MESIWTKEVEIERRTPLKGTVQADVAVLGAGMAGILTAYELEKRGVHAVVLDAGRTASGQTKGTTAKITCQHALIYGRLAKQGGEHVARLYAKANQEAIEEYLRICEEEQIDCRIQRRDAYLYSCQDMQPLLEEEEAARRAGIKAKVQKKLDLPLPVLGALRFADQAQFHPLLFLRELSKRVQIYENSRAAEVLPGQVRTGQGDVHCQKVVFCTHYPFVNAPGFYFRRLHQERSYVLALRGAGALPGMCYGIDPDGLSFRDSGPYVLLGGEAHRTGQNPKGGRYEGLEAQAKQMWPGAQVQAKWSAQDCITTDGVPYIGRYSSLRPDWYVATGFGKWGMTGSMCAARVIADLIVGGKSEYEALFEPGRETLPGNAKRTLMEGMEAMKGLTRQVFSVPSRLAQSLEPGHGGVVEIDGKKAGVYKDETGEVFAVDVRCPHLGCELSWNPDEKSWDCPCHGSRFDHRGRLLDGPAQEGI